MIKVKVIDGDITNVLTEAIISPINSGGLWYGGIDRAIFSVAGNQYHDQVREKILTTELNDLDIIIAKKTSDNRGLFKDVVFVIDDLKSSLDEVILKGLRSADNEGYRNISLPAIRTGVMKDAEKDPVTGICNGINNFIKTAKNIHVLNVIIYQNLELSRQIRQRLKIE